VPAGGGPRHRFAEGVRSLTAPLPAPGVVRADSAGRLRIRHAWRVAESFETQFLHADLEVGCPRCEYPLWVTGAEVIAQAAVTCPCCRVRIWLRDSAGSVQNASRDVDQALKGIRR